MSTARAARYQRLHEDENVEINPEATDLDESDFSDDESIDDEKFEQFL